jgi:hypothetical protein
MAVFEANGHAELHSYALMDEGLESALEPFSDVAGIRVAEIRTGQSCYLADAAFVVSLR